MAFDPCGDEGIRDALDSANPITRAWAADHLVRRQLPATAAALTRGLAHPDPAGVRAIAHRLADSPSPRAVVALDSALEDSSHELTRAALLRALLACDAKTAADRAWTQWQQEPATSRVAAEAGRHLAIHGSDDDLRQLASSPWGRPWLAWAAAHQADVDRWRRILRDWHTDREGYADGIELALGLDPLPDWAIEPAQEVPDALRGGRLASHLTWTRGREALSAWLGGPSTFAAWVASCLEDIGVADALPRAAATPWDLDQATDTRLARAAQTLLDAPLTMGRWPRDAVLRSLIATVTVQRIAWHEDEQAIHALAQDWPPTETDALEDLTTLRAAIRIVRQNPLALREQVDAILRHLDDGTYASIAGDILVAAQDHAVPALAARLGGPKSASAAALLLRIATPTALAALIPTGPAQLDKGWRDALRLGLRPASLDTLAAWHRLHPSLDSAELLAQICSIHGIHHPDAADWLLACSGGALPSIEPDDDTPTEEVVAPLPEPSTDPVEATAEPPPDGTGKTSKSAADKRSARHNRKTRRQAAKKKSTQRGKSAAAKVGPAESPR